MDLQIRPMHLPEAVIERLRAATGKDLPLATDVLTGRVKFRECVDGGRVIGYCVGNSSTGEILQLSVDSSYRRQGIARQLLSLVVELMHADGARRIWLESSSDCSRPAYGFYRAMGWHPTGEQLANGDEILELRLTQRGN